MNDLVRRSYTGATPEHHRRFTEPMARFRSTANKSWEHGFTMTAIRDTLREPHADIKRTTVEAVYHPRGPWASYGEMTKHCPSPHHNPHSFQESDRVRIFQLRWTFGSMLPREWGFDITLGK